MISKELEKEVKNRKADGTFEPWFELLALSYPDDPAVIKQLSDIIVYEADKCLRWGRMLLNGKNVLDAEALIQKISSDSKAQPRK